MQCVHWWVGVCVSVGGDFLRNMALEGCALLEETQVRKEEVKLCCRWEAAFWVEICGRGGVYEVEVRQGRRERKCIMGVWSTLPGCTGRLVGVFLCRSQK